jgi:putative DNA primase/helicase
MTTAAITPAPNLDGIGADLRGIPRWIHWRPVSNEDGKVDKIPTDPATGKNIDYTSAENWKTFDAAVATLRPGIGLGIVLNGDGLIGVDRDGCVGDDGTLSDDAAVTVRAFGSYAEISPSGLGLRIIARGVLPPNDRKRNGNEIYDRGRFLTITGNRVPGAPATIAEAQEAIDAFHAKYIARPQSSRPQRVNAGPPVLLDDEVLSLARNAENGPKFRHLWAGDTSEYGGDDSAADLSLLGILSFYSQDHNQLDRLFRRSGLYREKWERADYRRRTIDKALNHSKVYEPGSGFTTSSRNGAGPRAADSTDSPTANRQTVGAVSAWPARKPLPPRIPPAPTLPASMVPEPLRRWLVDAADRAKVPLEMLAGPAIVAAGGLNGRMVGIRPGRYDEFTAVTNLWGALVAPPGWMKTASYKEPYRPIGRLITQARAEHEAESRRMEGKAARLKAELKAIERRMAQAARGEPPKEGQLVETLATLEAEFAAKSAEVAVAVATERRYLTQDPTVEKFGELLRENPRGMTLLRDELSGFLLALEKPGREGDREFYLEAWNGTGSFTVDRIARGTLHIPSLTISVFGGIQPGKLKHLLDGALEGGVGDDGMMQRFQMLIAPDALPAWEQPTGWGDSDAKARADAIYAALDAMTPEDIGALPADIPYLRYSEAAQVMADAWRDALERRLRSGALEDTPAFASHLSKYRSLMPALALVFYLIDLAAQAPGVATGKVGEEHARLAADWCGFLEAHARKVYAAETHRGAAAAHALAAKGEAGAVIDGQPIRDLYRAQWSGLQTQDKVFGALTELTELGWLRVETRDTGANSSQVVRLHPALAAKAKARAEGSESHA